MNWKRNGVGDGHARRGGQEVLWPAGEEVDICHQAPEEGEGGQRRG